MTRSGDGINLIAMIGHADADLLPFFLEHYRRLGVAGFVLAFHGDWREETLTLLDAEPDVHVWDVLKDDYSDALRLSVLNAIARSFRHQWILHADADEFLELPCASLERTIRTLDVLGVDCLPALMVQRQTADGSLPELDPHCDLSGQLPCYNISLCEDLGLDWPVWKTKFPLIRITTAFRMRRGNHLPPNGRSVDHAPIRAIMHHYKWRSTLLKALELPRGDGSNAHEMEVYGSWLERHDGRLSTINARRCSRDDLVQRGFLVAPKRSDLRTGTFYRKIKEAAFAEEPDRTRVVRKLRQAIGSSCQQPDSARIRSLIDPANLLLRPGRICLLTFEIAPPFSGGTGSALMVLAERLSAAGHDVHVVLCPFVGPAEIWSGWYEYWESRGVHLDYVPRRVQRDQAYEEQLAYCRRLGERVQRWRPDLVHCTDVGGYGALLAILIASGLALERTKLIVTAHGSTRWSARANLIKWSRDEAAQTFCHDILMSLADVVCFPSRYMNDLVAADDIHVKSAVVIPNGLAGGTRSFGHGENCSLRPVDELVMFGRIEPRKGYDRFEAAIKALVQRGHRAFNVTLLGRFGDETGPNDVIELARNQHITFRHIDNLNHVDAVNYLKSRDCLAVVPSRCDNLPYTVYECLENGVPLLAAPAGGIPELVHVEDRSRILIADDHDALVTALADALEHGAKPGRLSFDPASVEIELLAIHAKLVDEARGEQPEAGTEKVPSAGIGAVVYGHEAVPSTPLLLEKLEDHVREGDLHSVHQRITAIDNAPTCPWAGTINQLIATIETSHLLFCHAAVQLQPEAVRAMARLIRAGPFDALVCDSLIGLADPQLIASEPLAAPGGPAVEAPSRNVFGAGVFMIKREAFLDIGGFDIGIGASPLAPWQLLNRLTAKGGRVVGIPKAMVTLWIDRPGALLDLMDDHWTELLVRPWIDVVSPAAEGLIRQAMLASGRDPAMQRIAHQLDPMASEDTAAITSEERPV